jgi:uncharacterized membrane protein
MLPKAANVAPIIRGDVVLNQHANNPYAPPVAMVEDPCEQLAGDGTLIPGGRIVPAGHGAGWVGAGWRSFKQSPGAWISMTAVCFLISIVVSLLMSFVARFIPYFQILDFIFLIPLYGGVMIACDRQRTSGKLDAANLFGGLSQKVFALAIIGIVSGVLMWGGMFVIGKIFGFSFVGAQATQKVAKFMSSGALNMHTFFTMYAYTMAWSLVVYATTWYSPSLVIFHGVPVVRAMTMSFTASLRNILPWLIYGIIMFILAMFATLPILLGWLVLGPVMQASLYASYRDIFVQE